LSEAEAAESVGETKAAARARTLDRRTILFGLPAPDQILHSSARNIEGVMVAPVAEFNTYDILKQRYLVLTREALAELKDRVKKQAGARKPAPAAPPTES
jgi:large subunit ribosomal protein L4